MLSRKTLEVIINVLYNFIYVLFTVFKEQLIYNIFSCKNNASNNDWLFYANPSQFKKSDSSQFAVM